MYNKCFIHFQDTHAVSILNVFIIHILCLNLYWGTYSNCFNYFHGTHIVKFNLFLGNSIKKCFKLYQGILDLYQSTGTVNVFNIIKVYILYCECFNLNQGTYIVNV